MRRRKDGKANPHSVFNEPHMRPEPPGKNDPPDGTDACAGGDRAPESRSDGADTPDVLHSVFSEPGAGGGGAITINHDFPCPGCGYNLRGLIAGQACPECGRAASGAPASGRSLSTPADTDERDLHSVFDEPGGPPSATPIDIKRDWLCSRCGYNLRGLTVGHPCPECGEVEMYRPTPEGGGYGAWLARKAGQTSGVKVGLVIAAATVVSGALAVLGTFINTAFSGRGAWAANFLSAVVVAPPVEEVMKFATAAILVERWPYLIRRPSQLLLIGVGSGLGFAAIENVLYLTVYIPNPTLAMVLWRWLVCTSLHSCCAVIAARGLVRVWQRTMDDGRRPRLGLARPALVTAMIVHAVYNAGAIAIEFLPVF